MADNLIQSVQEMLKEESWTRATINNYTQNNLQELSAIVEQAKRENCTGDIIALCYSHLSHTKESIIALYLSGMLSLLDGDINDSNLEILVDFFKKNHKEQIVTTICNTILENDPNNKFALRTLADIYKSENNDKIWELYTTLIKVDFEECELVKTMAEHYEELGDCDTAIDYYKKALLRYVNARNLTAIKEIWTKLVGYIPEEIDFFQLVRRKISKTINEDKTIPLMQELYAWYKENKKWDTAIEILKQNLNVDSRDLWARKEIVDCYKGKYEDHSHLDEYIRNSNLNQSFRNVFEAINDFEKHIAFDKGSFVFHKTWGVGIIRRLKNDTLTINFGKNTGIREMSLKMAITALQPLSKDHIWVLKATEKPENLNARVKEDKVWALKTIIKSFGNSCDFKRIKAELVPSVLSPGEWTNWNSAAKRILETDSSFGVTPNNINCYTVREHEISAEEKLSNEFKAQKQFFARVDILMKFFDSEATDKSSEMFNEMYAYFKNYLKNITHVDEEIIASFLVVKHIGKIDKQFDVTVPETFEQLYRRIEDPRKMYEKLKDTKNTSLKKDFIFWVRLLPNWVEQFIFLFPTVLDSSMLDTLVKEGHAENVQKLARDAFENFRDYREAVLFFFKECQEKDWFKNAGISYEKQLIALINIIELTFREINSHVNTTENKKINRNATLLLFKDDAIFNYMFSNSEDIVKRMYTLINDIADIDPSYKAQMRSKILEKYPDFKFQMSEEKTSQISKGMLVTKQKLDEKKAQVEDIQNVQLPEIAKEVAEAREKGDLKENAEYKSARERQHMLGLDLARLQGELARAVVFDPTTLTTTVVSFATVITLKNNDSGEDEEYTILGPWESDPTNGIISYMSPFGNALMDKKVGDTLVFTINESNYNYTVKAIKAASI